MAARDPSLHAESSVFEASGREELDRALDALAAILRVYGRYAFDTDQRPAADTYAQSEELARVLLLGPRKSEGPKSEKTSRRDFRVVQQFVDVHRKHEHEFVQRGLGNLRETVEAFARCITAAVVEDQRSDERIETHLVRLVEAVRNNDIGTLRGETQEVVGLVRASIERRRQREKNQLLELGKRVQTLRNELDAARIQAVHDPLTKVFNRAAFDEELSRVATLGLLLGPEPCLVLVDADHFKSVNDRYGHPAGDEVLKAVADNIVRHFMRKEDFVSRIGGEEFAVVVRESTLEKVAARADRMREAQETMQVKTSAGPITVTLSVGIACLVPGQTPDLWVERADRLLYSAKHNGRNRIELAKG